MLTVLLLGEMYVKAIVFYALIAPFVVHLVARAYWVGLVGLHSVFPKGVNCENYKSGPLTLEVYKARLVSLAAIISRVDNFCSMIFSFAFLLVILFAFTVFFCGVLGALAYAISHAFLGGTKGDNVFLALTVLAAIVPAGTSVVDRRYGATLGPRGQRWLKRMIVAMYRGTSQSVISPIFIPLLANVGRTKIRVIFFTSLFGILFIVMAERFARQNLVAVNSYDYFAVSARFGVDYRFYESQRAPEDIYQRLPSIQSDVISGPSLHSAS
ncbi:MAG TPA: hypothetical protein VJO33_17210 [Gemmatimonadaceae bacterium]|nr:hypothetical protein [Gemmatimonadaceae bacterium]